jgi:hypothetical protein
MPVRPPTYLRELASSGFTHDLVGSEDVAEAIEQINCRIVETRLLSDQRIREIAGFWELYLGRQEQMIRERLVELGVVTNLDELTRHLFELIGSYSSRTGETGSITPVSEYGLFEAYTSRSASPELRCECCGYHFRERDLNPRRLAIAASLGLGFAECIHPKRLLDEFKPTSISTRDDAYLQMEIDHDVPWAALGRPDADNLRVLCRLCNRGKGLFVYSLESLSMSVATSLLHSYRIDEKYRLLVSVVSALRYADGVCALSGAKVSNNELTVRLRKRNQATDSEWLVPWNLEVVSYDAVCDS